MIHAADPALFFTKKDPSDPRLGEYSKAISLEDAQHYDFTLLGYPDDEGIKLNGGRLGAGQAPNTIREFFYKMTPSLLSHQKWKLGDVGNLDINLPLEQRHQNGKTVARKILDSNTKLISLGGGHDYAYCDGAAFIEKHIHENPLIINIDAHLDVRDPVKGLNSGTAFHRLLTQYSGKFEFVEMGIQPQCNSQHHYTWAKSKNAHVFTLQETLEQLPAKLIEKLVSSKRPCYLSVDIDAFCSSEAPGCSQSFTSGWNFREFTAFFKFLKLNTNLRLLGVYEVSPALDQDHRTSKLAALILHQFISL
jgi:formiminoglutamase